jgi:hypothetical protein
MRISVYRSEDPNGNESADSDRLDKFTITNTHEDDKMPVDRETIQPRFNLGQTVATPGVLAEFERASQIPGEFLGRHAAGDWGEVDAKDKALNDADVDGGGRLLSAYKLSTGVKVWIITEADRSSTCLLLPEEY